MLVALSRQGRLLSLPLGMKGPSVTERRNVVPGSTHSVAAAAVDDVTGEVFKARLARTHRGSWVWTLFRTDQLRAAEVG